MVDQIESSLAAEILPVRMTKMKMPAGRARELTWGKRAILIAFHLHSYLGSNDFDVFDTVFGHLVNRETLRSWLREENIFKWLGTYLSPQKRTSCARCHRSTSSSSRRLWNGDNERRRPNEVCYDLGAAGEGVKAETTHAEHWDDVVSKSCCHC